MDDFDINQAKSIDWKYVILKTAHLSTAILLTAVRGRKFQQRYLCRWNYIGKNWKYLFDILGYDWCEYED
jgi:hypothetical protein